MQINSVYLYPIRLEVYTTTLASWTTERYRKVYNNKLKVYRSVDNRIDLQVRNSDQKALSYTGTTLVFNLVARDGKDLVFSKDFNQVSVSSGTARLIISQTDLLDLEPGMYNYSINQETREVVSDTEYRVTSRVPMYFDAQYEAIGTIEVSGDVLGVADNSLEVNKFNYTNPFTTGDVEPRYYISSIIDAQHDLVIPQSLHTFQIYSTNYSGTVTIQGSIREDAAPSVWTDLLSFTPTANLEYKNVEGKYNWFRIKHTPSSSSSSASFTITQTILLDYVVNIHTGGYGYRVGDTINFNGRVLGGEAVTNDLTITVTAVTVSGVITGITWAGTSYNGVQTFVLTSTVNPTGTIDKILYR